MPSLNVQAQIEINATPDQIHKVLTDFHTWPAWSPWLYIEPEANVTYRGTAGQLEHGYDWLGDKTGAGGMSLTRSDPHRIECDLQFLKPFKSQADVAFDLSVLTPKSTRVTWLMDSSLPFFLFWMKASMSGMIRADYSRGLTLLKDYVELDAIPSGTTPAAVVQVEALHHVGLQATSTMDEISLAMGKSFETLMAASTNGQFSMTGAPFCFYNKVDFKNQRFTYTAAIPCDNQSSVEPPLIAAERPACTALKVVHTGAYRHLGNAWSKLMAEAKAQKLKVQKSQPPFEHYLNDPADVNEADLITEIFLPLKS